MFRVAENADDARAQLEALSAMCRTDGWGLFDAYLDLQEKSITDLMCAAKDGTQLAILAGTLKGIRDLRTWPRRQAEACDRWIRSERASAEPTQLAQNP